MELCRRVEPKPTCIQANPELCINIRLTICTDWSAHKRPHLVSLPSVNCTATAQSAMQEVNFGAGEVLGSDGADGEEYIYLIAQGQVDVLRSTSSAASEMADADADDDIADDSHCQYPLICSHGCFLVATVLATVVLTDNKGLSFADALKLPSCWCENECLHGAAGEMSGKSVTELVSNLRCPFEGEGHVWLATRGPGEFVGGFGSFLLNVQLDCAKMSAP